MNLRIPREFFEEANFIVMNSIKIKYEVDNVAFIT